MMKKYHIAILSPQVVGIGKTPENYSSQQINLALCWANLGHYVDVITGKHQGINKALSHERIRVFEFPLLWLGGKKGLPVMIGGFFLLKKDKYDIIFSSEHYQPATFLACVISKKVVIYQGHNTVGSSKLRKIAFLSLEKIFLPLIRKRYLKVIAKTKSAEEFMRARGFERCVTIPCGYDSNRFRFPTLQEKQYSRNFFGIKPTSKVLVYAGNLLPRRDIKTVIKALAKLKRWGIDVIFLIAGDGPERKYLQEIAEKEHVSKFVKFLGELNWKQLRNVYWAGDVFVFPTHYEIFGLVLLEALACGLRILTTPCPAAKDILKQCPEAGKIVPIGDSEAFAKEALALFSQKYEISSSVKSFLKSNDWNSISKRILEEMIK